MPLVPIVIGMPQPSNTVLPAWDRSGRYGQLPICDDRTLDLRLLFPLMLRGALLNLDERLLRRCIGTVA